MIYLRHLWHVFEANKYHRGEDLMHEHGPDELYGPIRGTPAWWRGTGAPPKQPDEGTPTPTKLSKKRKKTTQDAKPIRTELVERVRQEIAAGTYETQEKWEAALDCLLDRLDRVD
jgi:hypothetical protein